MMPASEIRNFTWLNGEARQAVMDVFNAVSQWRDEISRVNERYLTDVLDQVAAAQRAQGWPNSVTVATREHLLQASKVQAQMIDQLMGDWEQQLKSRGAAGPVDVAPAVGSKPGGGDDAARRNDAHSVQNLVECRRGVAAQLGRSAAGLHGHAAGATDQKSGLSRALTTMTSAHTLWGTGGPGRRRQTSQGQANGSQGGVCSRRPSGARAAPIIGAQRRRQPSRPICSRLTGRYLACALGFAGGASFGIAYRPGRWPKGCDSD